MASAALTIGTLPYEPVYSFSVMAYLVVLSAHWSKSFFLFLCWDLFVVVVVVVLFTTYWSLPLYLFFI